jgi:hypothetical protein
MSPVMLRRSIHTLCILMLLTITSAAFPSGGQTLSPEEPLAVVYLDMSSVFNRDGVWSIADPTGDGFDNGGGCLIEDGYSGWPGLPSDGRIQDLQLGDYDAANMFSVFAGDGDTTFDLSATGQAGTFQSLRFLTGAGNGYSGTDTDKLMVQLVYDDSSTQEFLLLSQDWYLGDPPRVPPAPLTLGISGMLRSSGEPSANFGLFVHEFTDIDPSKTLTQIVFMESDPQSTIGDPAASNRFNVLAITGYSLVDAGPDQNVMAGDTVTLSGTGPDDATSSTWEQIIVGDEPVVTLDNPNNLVCTFTAPARTIGYVLKFRLTVVSPTAGSAMDECIVYAFAPNAPTLVPGNFRAQAVHLGYRLEWDGLMDALDYGVGLKLAENLYFWFWTTDTYYDLLNLTEGQATSVALVARNSYGEGPRSPDVTLVPMRNYALPATLGGTNPPDDYVYVISHYAIAGMNNKVIQDENNDSWDGNYKEEDYWGYLWPENMYIGHVTYFTGNMFGDGGWFTHLTVQYTKDGTSWIDVPTQIVPDYDFSDQRSGKSSYARYDMHIPALYGMGVRIAGTPGGSATFTSIAELQVFADHQTSRPLVVQGVDAEVPERATGTIDASFSFSTRGDITSMIYSQISGPSVTITVTGDPLIATFEAPGVDADTELVFQITGSDGTDTLSDEEVTITVKNLVTTAVAGPDQSVEEGVSATLDGSPTSGRRPLAIR